MLEFSCAAAVLTYLLLLFWCVLGSPKMFFHMVKTRQKQFELLKNGGKSSKEDKKKH